MAETHFRYGTSAGNLNQTVYYNNGGLSTPSGSYSVTVSSLSPATTYYYQAVMQVGAREFYGEVKSFTTSEHTPVVMSRGWMELPETTTGSNLQTQILRSGTKRNYSMLYDKSKYAALWVAYPLCASHISGSASTSSWRFNPGISNSYQVDITSHSYGTAYNASNYSRGHQIPNADRKSDDTMNEQTYYCTNQTPQIQNSFNDGIWSSLEGAIRNLTSSTDTVYVVTGPTYQKVGGNETITYLTRSSSSYSPAKVPVPNYYWKVLLKVKRSGSTITSAKAIGIWLEHKAYSGSNWQEHVVSVDTIEQYTGFDFFANLPDAIESSAESNTSWSTFSSF